MTATPNYFEALKTLLEELRQVTIVSMAATGIKETSQLSKSVKFILTKDGIKMEVAEYYGWVSEGRDSTKRPSRLRKVPLEVLIEWIKKNKIVPYAGKTINQLAFAIQNKIYVEGINSKKKVKGRKYADKVSNAVADTAAVELADSLAEEILDDLVQMFQPIAA